MLVPIEEVCNGKGWFKKRFLRKKLTNNLAYVTARRCFLLFVVEHGIENSKIRISDYENFQICAILLSAWFEPEKAMGSRASQAHVTLKRKKARD
jgi:hypothetical protein